MILVNAGIGLLVTPFLPAVINKVGKKNLVQYCGIVTIVGGVALSLNRPVRSSAL